MPKFAYRGRNSRGDLVVGRLEAVDSGAVADQLLSTGITPVQIDATAVDEENGGAPKWWRLLTAAEVGDLDVMLFSRQMYTLLRSGVPILRALAGLQESVRNDTLKDVIADLLINLDAGRELSTAMRRHPKVFSNYYVSIVRVGETTGTLAESFDRMFHHIEFERGVRERIKTALRYPIIVLTAILVAIAIVNFAVIPAFAKIFAANKVPLPVLTRVLIASSNFFLAWWPAMLVALVALFAGLRAYLRTEGGRYAWDRYKLSLPIAGEIITKATLSRLSRSLAVAMQSGVPIVQGLTVVADVVDNTYIAQRIEQMRDGVERGESLLRTAVAVGVFTPVVLQMIAVGEETGELDELLAEVARMYEREVDYEIRNLSANIEPLLTVAMGVMVLVLALGVFLPIWGIGKVMLGR
ncbi:MAG: type II secretion system F family protein [Burkholderiales bacterium]